MAYTNNYGSSFSSIPRTISTKPNTPELMIKDDILEKLKPAFEKVAGLIREAVNERRRIFIKHHGDCDGFCAGVALERAILPLIESVNEKKQAVWEKYKRMASMSPYYSLEDVSKDMAQFLNLHEKFGEKLPLVLLVDLGSGPENVLPIQQLQLFGCDVIVIDHHPVDATVHSLLKHHINPQLHNSPYSYSAGVLCAELSRYINKQVQDEALLSAISCVGDRVEEPISSQYFALVEKDGFTQEKLLKIAKSLDFLVFNLRGLEARELVGVLLGDNKMYQEKLVDLLNGELSKREEKIVEQVQRLLTHQRLGKNTVQQFAVSELILRDNYPRLGTIVGMIHEKAIKSKLYDTFAITIGTTPNSMTFRAQVEATFDFPTLLKIVQEKVPLSFAEGGGHPCAGTFRFAESTFDQVYVVVKEYLEKL